MKSLHYKLPYNDSELVWDERLKKYRLTPEYVKDNFDITFRDDQTLERRLKKNSNKVYTYLINRSYSGNRLVVDRLLNYTEEGRKFVLDILTSQIEADLETGFNDLTLQPSVNVASGQTIDRNVLLANQVSVDTELIADENTNYFGFNLFLQTAFPQVLYLFLGIVK